MRRGCWSRAIRRNDRVDDALTSLAGQYPRQAEVVELRYFGGLSVEETAANSSYRLRP